MEMNRFWTSLPYEIKDTFDAHSTAIELKRGEAVYRQGDRTKGLYLVERGLVGLVITAAQSGKEHLMRFFKDGQYFGHRALFAEEGYHGSAVALEKTSLKLVPKKIILEAVETRPALLKDIVRVLSKELRRCEVHQVMILENQILARTAQSLIYLKDLYPEHNWTRQEVANFCASTVSTVIKAMAELESRGFIRQDGRSIEILDRDGMIGLLEHDADF